MGEERRAFDLPPLREPLVDDKGLVRSVWHPFFQLTYNTNQLIEAGLTETEDQLAVLSQGPAPVLPRIPAAFPAPVHLPSRQDNGEAASLTVPLVQRIIRDFVDKQPPQAPVLTPGSARRFDRHFRPRPVSRQFGQIRGTTTAVTLYSPAANTIGTIAELTVANTTATSRSYRLFVDLDGTTYDEDSSLFWDIDVEGNTSDSFELFLPMNAAASLGVQASVNDALTFTISGGEIPSTFLFQQGPLGQLRPSVEDVAVSLVATGTNERTIVTALFVSNVAAGGKSAEYSIFHDIDGATYDDTTALARNVSLGPGKTDVWFPKSWTLTDTAGNVGVETNDGASELCFTAFGLREAA